MGYSRTSIIQTPLYQLNHKSVQISEYVWINKANLFVNRALLNYSNRTYTWDKIVHLLTKYSNRTVITTVPVHNVIQYLGTFVLENG